MAFSAILPLVLGGAVGLVEVGLLPFFACDGRAVCHKMAFDFLDIDEPFFPCGACTEIVAMVVA